MRLLKMTASQSTHAIALMISMHEFAGVSSSLINGDNMMKVIQNEEIGGMGMSCSIECWHMFYNVKLGNEFILTKENQLKVSSIPNSNALESVYFEING